MKISVVLLLLSVVLLPTSLNAEGRGQLPETEISVTSHDGTELSVYHYPAQGDYLIIWVGSGYGINDRITSTAAAFAKRGIEIWLIDFAEALFATNSSNFMRNLDARYVADLIDAAHQRTGKKVLLLARAYGAIPVLRGATLWQQRPKPQGRLLGVMLFSPDLYAGIPALGKDPEYLPIVRMTDVPLLIFQGGRRGTSAQFPRLLDALTSHNPNVYFNMMPGVAGIFYEGDQNTETLTRLNDLPADIFGYIRLLEATPYVITTRDYRQPTGPSVARLDSQLQAFKGNPTPPPIHLHDINGKAYVRKNYTGKVTVVNFWATWCPPCVEEIPSLNRLRAHMQDKPFELISINYAEEPQHINEFMQRVSVQFPVLVDLDSKVSQQWNVIAFPSTFVIGKDGRIHYGVNAGIAWDAPDVLAKIQKLLQ